jgi:hypothetical protein
VENFASTDIRFPDCLAGSESLYRLSYSGPDGLQICSSFAQSENMFYFYMVRRAWGGVRHCATSRRVPASIPGHWGFFSGASDSPMCPGVDLVSKNGYWDIPGGKDGRCVRVTTLPPSCAECLEILEP